MQIFDKYGLGGIALLIAWRALTWLGNKGTELLVMHRRYLASTAKQVRRQTLIIRTQQQILQEHGVILRQIQERLPPSESPVAKAPPATGPAVGPRPPVSAPALT